MVQSTTKPACCSADTTGPSCWIASDAPVERIGTDLLVARRRHHDVERPRAHAEQGQFGNVHIQRARLRLERMAACRRP